MFHNIRTFRTVVTLCSCKTCTCTKDPCSRLQSRINFIVWHALSPPLQLHYRLCQRRRRHPSSIWSTLFSSLSASGHISRYSSHTSCIRFTVETLVVFWISFKRNLVLDTSLLFSHLYRPFFHHLYYTMAMAQSNLYNPLKLQVRQAYPAHWHTDLTHAVTADCCCTYTCPTCRCMALHSLACYFILRHCVRLTGYVDYARAVENNMKYANPSMKWK